MIAHGFWLRRFGGDRSLVGKTVRLNGFPLTVVGVTPPGFNGTDVGAAPSFFVPLTMKAQMTPTYDGLHERRYLWLQLMARLKPGVSRERAAAAMTLLLRQIRAQEIKEMNAVSENFRKRFVEATLLVEDGGRGLSDIRAQFSTPLVVLMSLVGLVLLIACANVANLLMARGSGAAAGDRRSGSRSAPRGRGSSASCSSRACCCRSSAAAWASLVAVWTGDLLLSALPFESATQAFQLDARCPRAGVRARRCRCSPASCSAWCRPGRR